MYKSEFVEILKKQRLILDGATGSNLIKRGNMPSGVCPEKWILENKEVLIGLQLDYLKAGTNILYAPTFTANEIKLSEYGLEKRHDEINAELVSLSKEAVKRARAEGIGGEMLVAGDLTMTGKQLYPIGTLRVKELIGVYKKQIRALVKAGVDLLVVETMMSLQECRCALIAAKEVCDLPVMVTMTFEKSGRALYGTDPLTALVTLQSLGAAAFGVNCGQGPDALYEIMEELNKYARIPLICKPNAGLPILLEDGSTGYSMDEKEFAEAISPITELSISLLGGCCGTAPEYIAALKGVLSDNYEPSFLREKEYYSLSSERANLIFDLSSPFMIVGERINPTGKKKLQAELSKGSFEMVKEFATDQEANGASVLDINMGMSGIDEKETMLKAIEEVSEQVNLPLCIDSSDPEVMEEALIHYPGKALVNSVSLEQVKIDKMLPLVKKYGASMILLPLSDEGLPKSNEDKNRIIDEILTKADSLDIPRTDIIVDGLVATVGANKNAALETVATIRHCHDDLKLATICGLSNISFGLPNRTFVNAAFVTMAITNGLTMAIANPDQDLLINSALAADLLKNAQGSDIRYIEHINKKKDEYEEKDEIVSLYDGKKIRKGEMDSSHPSGVKKGSETADEVAAEFLPVYNAVIKGNRDRIVELTTETFGKSEEKGYAKRILDEALLPAINKVGEFFDRGKYFLPQLIASAETMEKAISYLEPFLKGGSDTGSSGKIIVATVKGDIHDIGKNLVVLMLKNHGFNVVDLGKDVPKEVIVDTAIREQADIIALSALMTTTMKEMEQVILYAKEKGCKAKFMIGGAVITEDYAKQIGADGYSADAAAAAKLAENIVSGRIPS